MKKLYTIVLTAGLLHSSVTQPMFNNTKTQCIPHDQKPFTILGKWCAKKNKDAYEVVKNLDLGSWLKPVQNALRKFENNTIKAKITTDSDPSRWYRTPTETRNLRNFTTLLLTQTRNIEEVLRSLNESEIEALENVVCNRRIFPNQPKLPDFEKIK